MKAHVLSVGQCSADDARIARMLAVEADGHLDRAATLDEARALVAGRQYDLILVNRILDLQGESGVGVIVELRQDFSATPMMLVSDYPEAHAEAIAVGAMKGFGKAALGTAEVGQYLRQVLHSMTRAGQLR